MKIEPVARAALMFAVAVLTACGGESGPPRIDTIQLEIGGEIAVIGENLSLTGSGLDGDTLITIGGIAATVLEANRSSAIVRIPPGTPAGTVEVVATRDGSASAPLFLQVRRLAYTANFTDLTLSVLSVEGLEVQKLLDIPVDVPPGPFAVAFTPDGRRAVVACSIAFLPQSIVDSLAPGAPAGNSVAIVDVIRSQVIGVVATGTASKPTGIAVSPDGTTAWVTNYAPSTISVIDIESISLVGEIAVPRQPEEIAVSADGSLLLVPSDGGTVSTVASATGELGTVETGGNDPSGVAFSPDATTGYVTNSFVDPSLGEDGTLTVLDLSTPASPRVGATIAEGIGPTPYDVDVAPGGGLAVVTNLNVLFDPITIGPGSISLVDLTAAPPRVVTTIAVGTAPIHAAITEGGAVALVGNGLSGSVSVVDLTAQRVTSTIALDIPIGPADVAIQP